MSLTLAEKCDICGMAVEHVYGQNRLWNVIVLNDERKDACANCFDTIRASLRCTSEVLRVPVLEIARLEAENETLRKLCDKLNTEIKTVRREA